ncbi:MAG: sigma 54-interacting transcriptional regulator [Ferruginibacter sp.]
MKKKILIIDDDLDMCVLLTRFLTRNGYEAEAAHSGAKGIEKFVQDGSFEIVICDYRLGDKEGIEVLEAIKNVDPNAIVLIITGYSDIKTAVEVIKSGAYDYITKPLVPDEVLNILSNISKGGAIKNQPAEKFKKAGKANEELFVQGQSAQSRTLYHQAEIVANTNYSVILYGESGTGKEVIAKTIHNLSNRKDKPFIAIDCGTLSKELAGSELFGHMKGAFTAH